MKKLKDNKKIKEKKLETQFTSGNTSTKNIH